MYKAKAGQKQYFTDIKLQIFTLLLACMVVFAACSASPRETVNDASPESVTFAREEASEDGSIETGEKKTPSLTLPKDNRKIILTADLTIEALDFPKTISGLQDAAAECGGYISSTNIEGGENSHRRYANITFKIPAEKYSDFLASSSKTGNLISRNETSEDVTKAILDVESRLTALRTQETRLLKLMEEAGSLKDLITIQEKLSDVQYEIENYTAEKKSIEHMVAYSTINVTINEVIAITEVPPVTYSSRAANAFFETWKNVWNGIKELSILLIWMLPFIILLLVVFAILLVIWRRNKKNQLNKPVNNAMPPANTPQEIQANSSFSPINQQADSGLEPTKIQKPSKSNTSEGSKE